MTIQTERLQLREILLSDADMVHELHSHTETDQYNTLGIPATLADTEWLVTQWVAMQQQTPQAKYVFYIANKIGAFIGIAGISLGKPGYNSAEIWYKLSPKKWREGYATETAKALVEMGFHQLDLHRIEAGCATANIASIRVLEKAGFTREGLRRKKLPIRGEWVDNYEYAILKEDLWT